MGLQIPSLVNTLPGRCCIDSWYKFHKNWAAGVHAFQATFPNKQTPETDMYTNLMLCRTHQLIREGGVLMLHSTGMACEVNKHIYIVCAAMHRTPNISL